MFILLLSFNSLLVSWPLRIKTVFSTLSFIYVWQWNQVQLYGCGRKPELLSAVFRNSLFERGNISSPAFLPICWIRYGLYSWWLGEHLRLWEDLLHCGATKWKEPGSLVSQNTLTACTTSIWTILWERTVNSCLSQSPIILGILSYRPITPF